jgi:hypothetical protein
MAVSHMWPLTQQQWLTRQSAARNTSTTMWKYLWLVTNKVRNLGHELLDEFKSVSDGSNCYHILTDDKGDCIVLYCIKKTYTVA